MQELKLMKVKDRLIHWFSDNPEIAPLPFVLVIVFILMSLVAGGRFLSGANIQSMAMQLPVLGLFSLAMMVALLSGGLNLSVITTANLSGIWAALVLTRMSGPAGVGGATGLVVLLAIGVAITGAAVLGLINGFLIAIVGVSPILATLGTMTLYEGIAIVITRGYVISSFPGPFLFLGNGSFVGIPVSLIIFIICAFLMSVLLRKRPYGISLYMFGSNEKATVFSGINTKVLIMQTYVISGVLSGIAGVIMTARFNSANAGYGSSYLLITVVIAVLGGVNPSGGFGKVSGIILALVILQIISSGLNMMGITAYITISLWGILLIFVLGLNRYLAKRKTGLLRKDFLKRAEKYN